MKIDIINPDKLQLSIRQRLIRSVGLLFIIGSLLFFSHLMMQYQIVCNQKQYNQANDCVLKNKVYTFYQNTTDLGELKQAVVISNATRKGSILYSLHLNTSNGVINLTGDSSSGQDSKDKVATSINEYIRTSLEKSFNIPYPTNWFLIFVDVIILLAGLGLLYFKDTIIIFDKKLQNVIIKRQGLLGKGTEVTFPLSEIDGVIIETTQDSGGSPQYRLALAFKNKPPIPLIDSFDSFYDSKVNVVNEVNEFMGDQGKKP